MSTTVTAISPEKPPITDRQRIFDLENRVAELEKNAHSPVNLLSSVQDILSQLGVRTITHRSKHNEHE